MAKIAWATDEDFARYYRGNECQARWVGKSMRRGLVIAGFGGAIETTDGEWVAFLEIPDSERKPSLYRHVLEGFERVKEQGATAIKAVCDTSIPRAEELMRRLGFEPTDETVNGKVLWKWQN